MATTSHMQGARELEQDEWGPYFDELNKRIERGLDLEASIEIAGPDVDGTEAEHLPLDGITWEDGDDEIAIGLGGRGARYPAALWHFVDDPVRVWVREDEDGVPTAIGIESEDETYTFIRLRRPG
jgi:hypothetical protein